MNRKKFALTGITLTSLDNQKLKIELGDVIKCKLNRRTFKGRVYGVSDYEITIDYSDKYFSRTQVIPIASLIDIEVVDSNA